MRTLEALIVILECPGSQNPSVDGFKGNFVGTQGFLLNVLSEMRVFLPETYGILLEYGICIPNQGCKIPFDRVGLLTPSVPLRLEYDQTLGTLTPADRKAGAG